MLGPAGCISVVISPRCHPVAVIIENLRQRVCTCRCTILQAEMRCTGHSGVWTVSNRRESSIEHIVDLRDGLRHPVWGKVFGHKFSNRNDLSTSKRVAPAVSAKIKSYKPKTVDENDDSEDDERNSDLEAPIKSLAWYHPARICN